MWCLFMKGIAGSRSRLGKAEGAQIVEGLFGFGRSGEDGAVIGAKYPDPMREVAGVTVVEFGRQPEFGANITCCKFGTKFFDAVSIVTETLAECPVEPVFAPAPMGAFMPSARGVSVA
jgi:hypothetical protein